ncbi:MFS transporter [Kitasatospora sp. NPDC101176]|uniref:MFS transporter n=1 Tax=Kitasatospora sp. NPDC101176 TaxID=3364099 RepID=UPI0038161CC6
MAEPAALRTRVALWTVSLAMFCVQLDFFALNLAVPHMAGDLHVSAVDLQWVVSGYMLSAGSLMIAAGRLGDILGRRRMLLAGVVLFGLTSLAGAVSSSAGLLVAFRVLQGAGAALIMPVGFALLTNVFPEDKRSQATGFALAVAGIGTAVGPFVGGVLTQWAGWRWVFLINVPLAAATALLALRVPESRDEKAPRSVDWPGLATVTAAIAALTAAVDRSHAWGWASPRTLGLLAFGVVCFAAFTAVERRAAYPLVDLGLFRHRLYVAITVTGTVANTAAVVYLFVATLYLQQVRHLSPVDAGVVFLVPATATAVAGPLAGRLAERYKPLTVMAAATALGGVAVLVLAAVTALSVYVLVLGVCGGALGLAYAFTTIGTQAVIRPERAGEASGVTLTAMTTAGGMGMALAGSTLAGHTAPTSGALAFPLVIVAGACLVTAGGLAAVRRRTGLTTDVEGSRVTECARQLSCRTPGAEAPG